MEIHREDQTVLEHDPKRVTFGLSTYMKRAVRIGSPELESGNRTFQEAIASTSTSALIMEFMSEPAGEEMLRGLVSEIRKAEQEHEKPILVVLSLLKSEIAFDTQAFRGICKFTYMTGFDAILVRAFQPEQVEYVRDECFGLRGRRVKIFVDNAKDMSVVQASDGVFVDDSFSSSVCAEILRRQKLLFTYFASMTDIGRTDVLVYPNIGGISPPTTEPSTPVGAALSPSSVIKSFLFNELLKFLSPSSSRLIIAFSDDGSSAAELSAQSRSQKRRIPPILALTASESVWRYMGCLYGVIPLRMQSFVSVPTVINQALLHAKSMGLVEPGDMVAIVLNAPPVTASTNETCFEGIVQTRRVD